MILFSGSHLQKNFTPHSCGAAATSKTKKLNVNLEVLKRRLLEEYENFLKTWKRNNLLCRWWCILHEDNKPEIVFLQYTI